MPWIAFAPDISGVCKTADTFEITSIPTKIESTKIVNSEIASTTLVDSAVANKILI
jgi:hypothetical protein